MDPTHLKKVLETLEQKNERPKVGNKMAAPSIIASDSGSDNVWLIG
jgi:hypothetical protein